MLVLIVVTVISGGFVAGLKAGELYSAVEAHDLAAGVFREYLRLFPPQRDRRPPR